MDRNDIDRIIERIKASPSRHFVKKIAPELDTLEAAVSLSIITWREIAMALGVNPASIARARRRARELLDEWKKTGVLDQLNKTQLSKTNVKNDFNGANPPATILQSSANVLQSNQSSNNGSAGGDGMIDEYESKMRLIEAFRKSKPF